MYGTTLDWNLQPNPRSKTQMAINFVTGKSVWVASFVLLTITPAISQSLKDIGRQEQEFQKAQKLETAIKTLDAVDAQIDRQVKARELTCMKVVGSTKLCGCLGKALPWVFSFEDYVAITSKSKDVNNFSKLDKETQKAYEMVGPIRDRCVADMAK
jgi:hypothetical protein